jgi:hypothetical protein
MRWFRRETIGEVNLLPGKLIVWGDDAHPDRLLFGVDVVDQDGAHRHTVEHNRHEVRSLWARLGAWLDGDTTPIDWSDRP